MCICVLLNPRYRPRQLSSFPLFNKLIATTLLRVGSCDFSNLNESARWTRWNRERKAKISNTSSRHAFSSTRRGRHPPSQKSRNCLFTMFVAVTPTSGEQPGGPHKLAIATGTGPIFRSRAGRSCFFFTMADRFTAVERPLRSLHFYGTKTRREMTFETSEAWRPPDLHRSLYPLPPFWLLESAPWPIQFLALAFKHL